MAAGMLFMVKGTPMLQQHSKQIFSLFASRPFLLPLSKSRDFSVHSSLLPPDVPRLAETARISLSEKEVEEFAPKIQQVVNWFGQLQDLDLESIEPALRADAEGDNVRQDTPETFENREALIAAVPSYEEPYIKVPKVVNKE